MARNRTRHVAFWSEMLKDAPLPVPFAQRSRALAPVGFGLNRGPTARIAALSLTHAASDESALLAAFARALAEVTGRPDFLIACEIDGRASETEHAMIGPLAATVPLVCRVDATEPPEALAARLARDLHHARAHAAFDLAACEETFGAAWRAAGVVPRQIGFSYVSRNDNPPALLTATRAPLRFGRLTVRREADDSAIENDLRLAVTPTEDGYRAEIAYDRDVVSAAFAQALLDAFVRELQGSRRSAGFARAERANAALGSIPPAGHPPRRIGDAAAGALERGNAVHLVVAQLEIEHLEIVGDALRVRRERDRRHVLLQQPAQRDLRDAAPARLGDVGQHRIVEQAPAPERAIGDIDQPALTHGIEQLGLVEKGVILRLQRHQRLRAERDRLVEQRRC